MIEIAIVDDDAVFVNQIYNKIIYMDEDIRIEKYTDPNMFLDDLYKNNPNIVFLDIDMPNFSGIEVSEIISKSFDDIFIVFLTNRADLVFEAFNKNVIGFIPKSRIQEEWEQILIKIKTIFSNNYSTLKSSKGVISIARKDILYFERISRKLYLYTTNGSKYQLYYSTIQEFIKALNYSQLYLINKSEGVNLSYVESYKNPIVKLKNCKKYFYLSKYRKDDFLLKYFNSRKQIL